MKLQLLLIAASLLGILGCGTGTDGGSSGEFMLSTGVYVVSSSNPVPPDDCNLGRVFQNGSSFGITVSGASTSFELGGGGDKNPAATISGNSLDQGSATYDVDFNTAPPAGQRYDCILTITETVSGSLLANNQAQVTFTNNSVKKAGTACTTENLGYKVLPCTSTVQFNAKKR